MDRVTTSRRALLRAASTAVAYATGAAIVGTGMALAGEVHGETFAAAPVAQVSPELLALIVKADELHRNVRAHDDIYHAVYMRHKALVAEVPHETVNAPCGVVLSTESAVAVRHARNEVATRVSFWGPGADEARRQHEADVALAAAADRRDAALAKIDEATRLTEMRDENDRLNEVFVSGEDAVLLFEARSLADIARKVAFAEERGILTKTDCAEHFGCALAQDISRLAGRA